MAPPAGCSPASNDEETEQDMSIRNDLDLRLDDAPDTAAASSNVAATPRRSARRGLSPTRVRLMIAGFLLLFATGYLVVSATGTSAVYFLTISEMRALGSAAATQPVRLGGVVVPGTIQRDSNTLRFIIVEADPEIPYSQVDPNAPKIAVTYKGVIPDIFQNEVHVVVEGKLITEAAGGSGSGNISNVGDGVFDARTLLAKCPSRFETMPAGPKPDGHPEKQVSG